MSLGNYFKFGVLAFVVAAGVDACTGDKVPADPAVAEAMADANKFKQCVSVWDGSIYSVVKIVKESLRDPSSFEHVDTGISGAVAPVAIKHLDPPSKEVVFVMKYRARNGFGGVNVEAVMGYVEIDTCRVKTINKF